jgi:hypothetical protein
VSVVSPVLSLPVRLLSGALVIYVGFAYGVNWQSINYYVVVVSFEVSFLFTGL